MRRVLIISGISILAVSAVFLSTCTRTEPPAVLTLTSDSLAFKMVKDSIPPDSQTVIVRTQNGTALPDSLIVTIAYIGSNSGWDSIGTIRRADSVFFIVNHLKPGALALGTYRAVVSVQAYGQPESYQYAISFEITRAFYFSVISLPIPGYENVVDAVTKASDIAGGIDIRVEQPADPTDSIKDVRVNFGEGDYYNKLNGAFPTGPDYVTAAVWFVRPDTAGICTTSVSVTTYRGFRADTSIRTRILAKDQH
jgi:hypothetical protein